MSGNNVNFQHHKFCTSSEGRNILQWAWPLAVFSTDILCTNPFQARVNIVWWNWKTCSTVARIIFMYFIISKEIPSTTELWPSKNNYKPCMGICRHLQKRKATLMPLKVIWYLNLLKYHPEICQNAKSVIPDLSNLEQSWYLKVMRIKKKLNVLISFEMQSLCTFRHRYYKLVH